MGRAGAGGGGDEYSGGGHSSGRSSGGHHVSSGSSGRRAGGGSFSGNNSYHGYHNYNGPFGGPPPYRGYGGGMFPPPGPPPRRDTVIVSSNPFGEVMAFIVTIIIVFVLAFGMKISNNSSIPKSTQNREKITANIAYDNNCIVDNIGWFDNLSKTEKAIKYFYDKTGIQPYVVLNAYDNTLTTDAQKEQYAKDWYSKHIKNEDTFLFMYFAEPDTDNDD